MGEGGGRTMKDENDEEDFKVFCDSECETDEEVVEEDAKVEGGDADELGRDHRGCGGVVRGRFEVVRGVGVECWRR